MVATFNTYIASKKYSGDRSQSGFTLIEVMVALLVVAIALPTLVVLVQEQTKATGDLTEKSIATWVAQNQLAIQQAEYRLSEKFLQGRVSSEVQMGGRTWYFEIVSEETTVEGMWRQTVVVGPQEDNYFVEVVGFLNE